MELQFTKNFNEYIMVCGVALLNMNVISLYYPPNILASIHDDNNVLSQHSLSPVLIDGDFNAHKLEVVQKMIIKVQLY